MEPELAGMLAAIEAGDAAVIGMLADWLEERGDPRVPLARLASQIDVEAVADTLYLLRTGKSSSGELVGAAAGMMLLGVPLGPMPLPLHPFVSREKCLSEVREAIARKKLISGVGRAIALTRRAKIDQLLRLFEERPAGA